MRAPGPGPSPRGPQSPVAGSDQRLLSGVQGPVSGLATVLTITNTPSIANIQTRDFVTFFLLNVPINSATHETLAYTGLIGVAE